MHDLEFLIELKENVEFGLSDITRHEMALTMINDWINELEHEKQQAASADHKHHGD